MVLKKVSITRIKDQVSVGGIKHFPEIQERKGLPSGEFLRYLQLKHFVLSVHSTSSLAVRTYFEELYNSRYLDKGLISAV
ncbi:hypothetical protein FKM82_026706 [Ascaphus truei]